MKFKKSYSAILLCVLTAVCLCFSQAAFVGAESDPQGYYEDNKGVVAAIDADGLFAGLKDKAEEDGAYFAAMQAVVEVAEEYAEFDGLFKEEDYLPADWENIKAVKDRTLYYLTLTEEKLYDRNGAAVYQAGKYIERIAADALALSKYPTKLVGYNAEKDKALKDVGNKYSVLLEKNEQNPGGKPNTVVGFYDDIGKAELEDVKDKFEEDLSALTLDKEDYDGSVSAVRELAKKAKDDLSSVKKNVVERAYEKLQDYYATENGSKPGNLAAEKQKTKQAIDATVSFFNNATDAVLKEYSYEKKAFDKFFDENEIDRSGYENRSRVSTEDGAVTVVAMDENGNPLKVFPVRVTLVAYDVLPTAPKRYNAERAIVKQNRNISIAYLIELTFYNPVEVWREYPTVFEGKKVVYEVSVDLKKYYENYVKGGGSFVTDMIVDAGINKIDSQDKTKEITEYAEYLKDHDGSLCYRYYKDGEDGAVKSLEYKLDGGTLMFKTNNLGAFAITMDELANFMLSPWFWLIATLALILIIVIIVLLVKYARYRVKFYSNGGTKVRSVSARNTESFVMPKNPTKEGHIFAGWFEDRALTRRFVVTSISRRRNLKAYAKWVPIVAAPVEVEEAAPVKEAAPVHATPEQLADYYKEIRKLALGYALAAENEKAVDGKMLVRAYKQDEFIDVYFAIDPAANGADKAEGAFAADTPATVRIENEEGFEKAKKFIDKTMTEYGLEPSGLEVGELKEGSSKGFGYRLRFGDKE